MAKTRDIYLCSDCGNETLKWMGRCPHCQAWNTLSVFRAPTQKAAEASRKKNAPVSITEAEASDNFHRLGTGIPEIDRVLGGGLVSGSVTLLGGSPGIGKSTLVSQLLSSVAEAHGCAVLYATGEESVAQTALRCKRLGVTSDMFQVLAETDVSNVLAACAKLSPGLVAIDSVQTLQGATESASGTISQIRACTGKILEYAKTNSVPVLLIGHVTKGGDIAGPKLLEHMVDTVLYFESENTHNYRVVRCHKNRFGSTHEIGVFEMKGAGLDPVGNPSAALLAERKNDVPGSAVVACLEGTRPLLVEVQSLVVPGSPGIPRRVAAGVDSNRMALLLAILSQRAGVNALDADVFISLAGGFRIGAPDIDLGIVLAVASSLSDRAVPGDLLCFGEVGLSGEVRAVPQVDARLREAASLGFSRVVLPKNSAVDVGDDLAVNLLPVADVREAMGVVFDEY